MIRSLPGIVLAAAALAACTRSQEPRTPAEEPSSAAAAAAPAAGRRPGESADSFAARHAPAPGDVLQHVADVALPDGRAGVAAFYMRPEPPQPVAPTNDLAGYLFVPAGREGFSRVLIDSIGHEGGMPELESVFLANADRDPAPELVLILSWGQVHYFMMGTFYGVQAYDAPDPRNPPRRLAPVELGDELQFQCECEWRDGRRERARFTTPEAVKAALAEANR